MKQKIQSIMESLGLNRFGLVALERPLSFEFYKSWIENGYAGEMSYLVDSLSIRANPGLAWPEMKSALVVAIDYLPHPWPDERMPLKSQGIALYARGNDYHHTIKALLKRVCDALTGEFPHDKFIVFTDSAPILERDLGKRAGLGWIGKNSCLLSKKAGSLFFIAEILTSIDTSLLPSAELPLQEVDHCGTCRRCIEACPTDAITEERSVDSRKCISYLTIEAKTIAEESLRLKMSGYFFGCDICQIVCPWNLKWHKDDLSKEVRLEAFSTLDASSEKRSDAKSTERVKLLADLRWILTTSSKQIQKALATSPLSRAAGLKLKRNALMVIGEQTIIELHDEVKLYADHKTLGELALWTLNQMDKLDQKTETIV